MREIIPNILKFMGWACFASAALYGTLMLADLMLGRSMDEIKFLSCAASFVAWPTFISLAAQL